MKNQFQLIILSIISSYTFSANAAEAVNYLNFIMGKEVASMSIDINNSCSGSGDNIPRENIATGFYKNSFNYYLKVKAKETHSKQCWENFAKNLINNDDGTLNYFPDFPDMDSYDKKISYKSIRQNGTVFINRTYYTPYDLFFSVTGNITLVWLNDKTNSYQISTMPITFILGKTSSRNDNTWFIVGDNKAEFNRKSGWEANFGAYAFVWDTGITLYDETHDQYFCLSSNLKDSNTIKVTVDSCKSYSKKKVRGGKAI